MLSTKEEKALEDYMEQMANYGHPLSMEQLRLKVALLTQERSMPFTNGIPGVVLRGVCFGKSRGV